MQKITTAIVGTGGFACWAVLGIAKEKRSTRLIGLIEPSPKQREAFKKFYGERVGGDCPPYFDSLEELLRGVGKPDVAYITTPHKFHLPWIEQCLKAGIDVLVEKPMVLDQAEAERVIALQKRTKKLVVVGFPGSLSPAMGKAKKMIAAGKIGRVQAVSAVVHQQWKNAQTGTWRQVPEISGGGFLFDTGSHAINTIVDLIGEDIAEVFAEFDQCGRPVEINAAIQGRFKSGIFLSITAIGDSFGCRGDIRVVGTDGALEIGMWGEYLRAWLPGKTDGYQPVPIGHGSSTWKNFVEVYRGKKPNPCPPAVGLRFAKLMDLLRASAKARQLVRPPGRAQARKRAG